MLDETNSKPLTVLAKGAWKTGPSEEKHHFQQQMHAFPENRI